MTDLTADFATWRVLIVDDKPDNLKLITLVLESRRAAVRALSDPLRVFDAIAEFQPNLILLDLAMPHLNGWEIQQQLRAMPEMANVPIIALTALSMQQDIEKAETMGFDGYITKPYRSENVMQELTACVARFFSR